MKHSLFDRFTRWIHDGELPLFFMHREQTLWGRVLNWTALRYERRHADFYNSITNPD